VAIVPPVALNLADNVFVFPTASRSRLQLEVRANVAKATGEAHLELENGWKVEPLTRAFRLADAGEQADLTFEVTPPPGATHGTVRAIAKLGGQQITSGMHVISYPHIPVEITFPAAEARAERVRVTTLAKKVGYVMAPETKSPKPSAARLRCDSSGAEDLATRNLSEFDAIVTGVRAYNVRADLRANHNRLLSYIQNGGPWLFSTTWRRAVHRPARDRRARSHRSLSAEGGPGASHGGRDACRVSRSEPSAAVHAQQITERDLQVGCRSAGCTRSEWDPRYESVFESHDPGEKPLLGGTLYTRYGKGAYIFTAFAWFRQLPAGVPGAYRIFANLISAGKAPRP